MISVAKTYDTMSFKGLSTDTKPTEDYGNEAIKNGSTFYEIDTGDLYMYDEENHTWIAQ